MVTLNVFAPVVQLCTAGAPVVQRASRTLAFARARMTTMIPTGHAQRFHSGCAAGVPGAGGVAVPGAGGAEDPALFQMFLMPFDTVSNFPNFQRPMSTRTRIMSNTVTDYYLYLVAVVRDAGFAS